MPFKPKHEGEFPSLGWQAGDWIEEHLTVPFGPTAGEPLVLTREQLEFLVQFYRLDPVTCRRVVRRASMVRPRGWGKSPLGGALLLLEGLGPVVPDGWDADGEPVAVTWVERGERADTVVLGTSEEQTRATWRPLQEMVSSPALLAAYPGVEPMESFVNLPRGKVVYATSSGSAIKGLRLVFGLLDQTELWVGSNGGRHLAQVVRDNITKVGGSTLETPNAYEPGLESVAELTHRAHVVQAEGRAADRHGILYDHREAPADTVLTDRDSALHGLAVAYGDSANVPCAIHSPSCPPGWVDLERVLADVWDPGMDRDNAWRDFFNQVRQSTDAWMDRAAWEARADATKVVADGEMVTLGFDGSRYEDSTALVGCRVSDGHLFLVDLWEKDPLDPEWEVDDASVHAALAEAMDRYKVFRAYCDRPLWETAVDGWAMQYGSDVVLDFPTSRVSRICPALRRFHTDTSARALSHDGDSRLTRHVLNAVKRKRGGDYILGKRGGHGSPNKIDAAMGAVLAYEARADAIAKGALKKKSKGRSFSF